MTIPASVIAALVLLATIGGQSAQAATCGEYSSQAAAQHAHDTRDGDGDGIYCESLPYPCAKPGDAGGGGDPQPDRTAGQSPSGWVLPRAVQYISFSATKYPNIRRHFLGALGKGWPRTLVLNRSGADARRDRLLVPYPTALGQDRDEYPPAVGRGKGPGLERGVDPRGWRADVRYVPSHENRSHGSTMGTSCGASATGRAFATCSTSPTLESAGRRRGKPRRQKVPASCRPSWRRFRVTG